MRRVLVVDDEPHIRTVLRGYLEADGFAVVEAADGETALQAVHAGQPDLVLLDVMLPGIDGLEVLRRLRAFSDVYVVLLTARTEEVDKLVGLGVGADDYVTKPFAIGELLARVRAVLRRVGQPAAEPDELRFDDVRVDFRSYEAERAGRPVAMTPKEFALLRHLSARPSEVVRRDALLDEVWGYGSDVTTRTVDNHVASLRAKLEQDAQNPRHLLTVHRVGYRWLP